MKRLILLTGAVLDSPGNLTEQPRIAVGIPYLSLGEDADLADRRGTTEPWGPHQTTPDGPRYPSPSLGEKTDLADKRAATEIWDLHSTAPAMAVHILPPALGWRQTS